MTKEVEITTRMADLQKRKVQLLHDYNDIKVTILLIVCSVYSVMTEIFAWQDLAHKLLGALAVQQGCTVKNLYETLEITPDDEYDAHRSVTTKPV
jgi:hypothetical protein